MTVSGDDSIDPAETEAAKCSESRPSTACSQSMITPRPKAARNEDISELASQTSPKEEERRFEVSQMAEVPGNDDRSRPLAPSELAQFWTWSDETDPEEEQLRELWVSLQQYLPEPPQIEEPPEPASSSTPAPEPPRPPSAPKDNRPKWNSCTKTINLREKPPSPGPRSQSAGKANPRGLTRHKSESALTRSQHEGSSETGRKSLSGCKSTSELSAEVQDTSPSRRRSSRPSSPLDRLVKSPLEKLESAKASGILPSISSNAMYSGKSEAAAVYPKKPSWGVQAAVTASRRHGLGKGF